MVATRIAAEGLGLVNGDHYAAGETAGGLGGQVAALLLNREVRTRLAERGRAIAEERWSIHAAARLQNKFCAEIASPAPRTPGD